jgi:hypothetical protein
MTLKSIINRGLVTVYVPLASFVIGCGFLSNWYARTVLKSDRPELIMTVTIVIATIVGWVWWSYKIVKWKCWAFSQLNIEDGYELYYRAVAVGLIWPIGHVFNKTEIWTVSDLEQWSKIEPEIREFFKSKDS